MGKKEDSVIFYVPGLAPLPKSSFLNIFKNHINVHKIELFNKEKSYQLFDLDKIESKLNNKLTDLSEAYETIYLVGHSLGAQFILNSEIYKNKKIKKIFLLDPSAGLDGLSGIIKNTNNMPFIEYKKNKFKISPNSLKLIKEYNNVLIKDPSKIKVFWTENYKDDKIRFIYRDIPKNNQKFFPELDHFFTGDKNNQNMIVEEFAKIININF